jgi:hypothetical protein
MANLVELAYIVAGSSSGSASSGCAATPGQRARGVWRPRGRGRTSEPVGRRTRRARAGETRLSTIAPRTSRASALGSGGRALRRLRVRRAGGCSAPWARRWAAGGPSSRQQAGVQARRGPRARTGEPWARSLCVVNGRLGVERPSPGLSCCSAAAPWRRVRRTPSRATPPSRAIRFGAPAQLPQQPDARDPTSDHGRLCLGSLRLFLAAPPHRRAEGVARGGGLRGA